MRPDVSPGVEEILQAADRKRYFTHVVILENVGGHCAPQPPTVRYRRSTERGRSRGDLHGGWRLRMPVPRRVVTRPELDWMDPSPSAASESSGAAIITR